MVKKNNSNPQINKEPKTTVEVVEKKKYLFEILNIQIVVIESMTKNNYILIDNNNQQRYYNYTKFSIKDYVRRNYPRQLLEYIFQKGIIDAFFYDEVFEEDILKDEYKALIFLCECLKEEKDFAQYLEKEIKIVTISVHAYECKISDEMIFTINNIRYFNTFVKKFKIPQVKPQLNDKFPTIALMLRNLCGNDETHYQHLLLYRSFRLKYPDRKVTTNWIIADGGGTGKTTFYGDFILNKLSNYISIGDSELQSDFNEWLLNYNEIYIDEIEDYHNEAKLKRLTGAKMHSINVKGDKLKTILSKENYTIGTNKPETIKISEDDRRWNMTGGGLRILPLQNEQGLDYSKSIFKTKKETDALVDTLANDTIMNTEFENFVAHLLALEPSEKVINTPIYSHLKKSVIDYNKPFERTMIDMMIDEGLDTAIAHYTSSPLEKLPMYIQEQEGEWFITMDHLYEIYEKGYKREIGNNYKLSKKKFFKRIREYDKARTIFVEIGKVRRLDNATHKVCDLVKNNKVERIDAVPFIPEKKVKA